MPIVPPTLVLGPTRAPSQLSVGNSYVACNAKTTFRTEILISVSRTEMTLFGLADFLLITRLDLCFILPPYYSLLAHTALLYIFLAAFCSYLHYSVSGLVSLKKSSVDMFCLILLYQFCSFDVSRNCGVHQRLVTAFLSYVLSINHENILNYDMQTLIPRAIYI